MGCSQKRGQWAGPGGGAKHSAGIAADTAESRHGLVSCAGIIGG